MLSHLASQIVILPPVLIKTGPLALCKHFNTVDKTFKIYNDETNNFLYAHLPRWFRRWTQW
jgi:hypothetical protein